MSEKDIAGFFPRLGVIPFDSERKTMTVISMINEKPFAIIKGAPEVVLPECVGVNAKSVHVSAVTNPLFDLASR